VIESSVCRCHAVSSVVLRSAGRRPGPIDPADSRIPTQKSIYTSVHCTLFILGRCSHVVCANLASSSLRTLNTAHCADTLLHMPPYPPTASFRADSMHRTRRQASHTLPRNFTFHYTDGLVPTTPEPLESGSPPPPPSPPRQTYRLRRRRPVRQLSTEGSAKPDTAQVPIPTIELPHSIPNEPQSQSFSVRPRMGSRRRSLPRTPSAQVFDRAQENNMDQDVVDAASQGETISRPSTACSGFSDSSVSSSIESFPSLGGSFTSPELESTEQNPQTKYLHPNSFAANYSSEPLPQQSTSSTHVKKPKQKWTEDMDHHLWLTYLRYMQDATKTPFKTAPGAPPPLGICSRIVREAKGTWKAGRFTTDKLHPWSRGGRADSPDTIKPVASGSTTPTGVRPKCQLPWPRSDAATRRRLRELCKRRSLHPSQYNRMLASRSPPFFGASASDKLSGPSDGLFDGASSFSTRDMSISLFSSTSSAVTALNRLTTDMTPVNQSVAGSNPISSGTPRFNSHQKSQSLHLGDSRGLANALASPFQPRSHISYGHGQGQNELATPIPRRPSLASPLELNQTGLGGFGRPQGLAPFPTANNGPPANAVFHGISTRRVRTRGFSLGDVNESSRRLTQMFGPPAVVEQIPATFTTSSNRLAPPPTIIPSASIRRLGSPFSEKAHFHTFPRIVSLHGLEPPLEVAEHSLEMDKTARMQGHH
jgi:hypothetical protein